MHEYLINVLSAFSQGGSPKDSASALFGALGYRSQRTVDIGSVNEFVGLLNDQRPLTERQHELFKSWNSADIVFQITEEEIASQSSLFAMDGFDRGRAQSLLFVAANLVQDRSYSRTELAEMTRTVNRSFTMPATVLFQHNGSLTLAAAHRRAHLRDSSRDVLERVSLVKDIRTDHPHRAHVDILSDLALPKLLDQGVRDFDSLHAAWESALDVKVLNRRFYQELFLWFESAAGECRFPDDGAGEGSEERHIIRLITRMLFIWFLKEKDLISGELFEDSFVRSVLRNHGPDRSDYYRAVIQNLFFATLNTEIDCRGFRSPTSANTQYCYRNLLVDPDGFIKHLRKIPFVNGGLFDCLDDATAGGQRIDVFTDDPTQDSALHVPASLLLDDQQGLFPLFERYKFTVEENTPIDQEVALDPELLGRVFENLLAAYNPETRETARRDTGSYYTPRKVVDYMVQTVLGEVLATKIAPADNAKSWRSRIDYLLDHCDAMDDAHELFNDVERDVLVNAIADLKVLDPAVGSGAFPMDILSKLTLALRRLDPDNALWEKHQKKRAAQRASDAFDTKNPEQRSDELKEISDTFEKYRHSDFGRKLYLIQNSIYGVDIQPIACQISKLRFFISLAIEQDPDPNASNLGIKPLPNLETKFVAADTLIGLQPATASLLADDAGLQKRKSIAKVRERYFLTDSRPKKLKCIERDQYLRGELKEILHNQRQQWREIEEEEIKVDANNLPNPADRKRFIESKLRKLDVRQRDYDNALSEAHKIAQWNPYDQNAHADWFDAEYMFGVQGGFDVVIGNPPYIQLQKDGGRLGKKYESVGYETYVRKGDIYQLFYEKGGQLLRPGGALAYITSNSWLRAQYGEPLREYLTRRHSPLCLLELGKDLFDAVVDVSVLILRSEGSCNPFPGVDTDRFRDKELPPPKKHWGEVRPSGRAPWGILSDLEWRIMEKMKARGKPLKDWDDISIYYGIKTGYNPAFIINSYTRNRLVAEDHRSADILRPILRGRDIQRYRARWAGLWLISTLPSLDIDIDDYPAVKRHLLSYGRKRLEQTGKHLSDGRRARKRTPHRWFELQDTCTYHGEFATPKLLWIELAERGRFAYDESGILAEATAFIMTGTLTKYLCAVLNSDLIRWAFQHLAPTSGMGVLRWKKTYLDHVPVPHVPADDCESVTDLVDEVLRKKDANPDEDTTELETEINQKVNQLYGLNPSEIRVIESRRRILRFS